MKRQQLIEDNMNLVYSLISKEYPTYLGDEDIIQSGMVGLCKAADKWDESKSKFTTYAWNCIRNEIRQEFINRKPHSQTISLSTKVGEDGTLEDILAGEDDCIYIEDDRLYKQLTQLEREIWDADLQGYSAEEIAENFNMSVYRVRKLIRLIRLKWKKFNE